MQAITATHHKTIVLVALFSYHNFAIRTMQASLDKVHGVKTYTIFFKHSQENCYNPPTKEEENLFIQLIRKLQPDLVGFSVISPYASISRKLTKLVKTNSS